MFSLTARERGTNVRGKRDYTGYQPIRLEPEVTRCDTCDQELRHAYYSLRRVAFLDRRQEIRYQARRCPTPSCEGSDNRYLPHALKLGVLPKYEYGLDVIAFIGQERLRYNRPFAQIAQSLRDRHGVLISERSVEDHFALYLALLSTDISQDSQRLSRLRAQGKIVLALDAAQPDATAESLWALRDALSEEILKAFSAPSMDAPTLAGHLRWVHTLGIPVAGVVSDGQNVILEAVPKVFPGAPHHLCHLHFLRDFAKLVTANDQALKEDLSKKLKGLLAFEKAARENPPQGPQTPEIKAPKSVTLSDDPAPAKAPPGRPRTRVRLKPPKTQEERILVRDVCELVRAILKHHGRYPLEAPGLETRDMLKQVLDALDEGLKKGGPDLSSCVSSTSMSASP